MRRTQVFITLAIVLAVIAMLSGCGKSVSPVAPQGGFTQQNADDLAIQAVTSVGLLGEDAGTAAASASATTPILRTRATRAAWDTTYTSGALSWEATKTYYTAGDVELPGYDPILATRMHWSSRAYGTLVTPSDTATVGHSGAIDVTGIEAAADTLHFDGEVADTLMNRFHSLDGTVTRYFYWEGDEILGDVRFLKSTVQSDPRPISGVVTVIISADKLFNGNRANVERHFDAVVVVEFHENAPADITVNATYSYHWDLVTGVITRV